MKKQISQIQNYLLNRITSCNFDSVTVSESVNGWTSFNVKIDGLSISFSVKPGIGSYCSHESDFKVEVPKDRLQNLIEFIDREQTRLKNERIEKLTTELKHLQAS